MRTLITIKFRDGNSFQLQSINIKDVVITWSDIWVVLNRPGLNKIPYAYYSRYDILSFEAEVYEE